MNLFIISSLTVLLLCIGSRALNIFPKLPIGPYKMVFKQLSRCESSQNHKIRHSYYLSYNHKSNVTEIRGSTNSSVLLDDTLFFETNFSFKDENGNWKDNTLYHKSPNACSSFRRLLGTTWTTVMDGLGFKNATCPILPGIYTASAVDTSLFSNANIPKTFIYGTFKIRFYYTLKKEVYSCNIVIIEFKPL